MLFRRLVTAILPVVAIVTMTGVAEAAKPPPAAPASITLNDAAPRLGGMVTFTVTGVANVKAPRIEVLCYKDGVLGWATAGAYTEAFKLGGDSSDWQRAGGAAQCTANLFYWNWHPVQTYNRLASTSFAAAG